MAEYIKRTEELVLAMNAGAMAIETDIKYHGNDYMMAGPTKNEPSIPCLRAAEILRESSETHAADVAPVRHGRWLTWEEKFPDRKILRKSALGVFCSKCGNHADNMSDYCPNCGAKMDEGNDDGCFSYGERSDGETVLGV